MKKRMTLSAARTPPGTSSGPARSRAGDLLRSVILANELSSDDVGQALCLPVAIVEELHTGAKVMSLPHQLCFATLLLARVPRLSRSAHALRAQALAATAFTEGRTKVHSQPPGSWRALKLL
ncbi:MAG: hypothetical protein ACRENU_04960 [Gemmatimonadaceae bacterium]